MDKSQLIETIIKKIPDAECSFYGESCNLKLEVISAEFKGMKIIEQHKKVMSCFKDDFRSGLLHALSISTRVK